MKKIFVAVFLFAAIASQTGAQTTLINALQYLQQKNYVAALDICNDLLAESANDPSVLGVRSQVYTAMGQHEQAMQDAEKALSVDNMSDRAHFAKAEALYYGKKDYNAALLEYDAVVKSNDRMIEAYAGKVRAYIGLQNHKEAMKLTETYLKTFPNDPELHYLHGLLNFQRGKFKQAVDDYDKALSVNPNWNTFQVYLNRGLANDALGSSDLALQDFSKAILTDPNNAASYLARGNLKYTLMQYREAAADFEKAEALNPDNSIITYNIGMAYYRDDDRASACKYFQKSCSQGNSNACKMIVLNCSDRKIN